MSSTMKTKDALYAEQTKQQLAKVSLRLKELEEELATLQDGLSRVQLKAKGLATLTTILGLQS
ncbi:MAG: hypothetical protein ACI8TV_000597 [Porticoccaceae bacterium]|jgi:hypothetical protein